MMTVFPTAGNRWAPVLKCGPRKVKILERAETMGDVPHAPNGFGKTLRVQFWTV
jgi:hypothetical protein